ncbi:hypothetical protein C8R43DRAFT_955555 [Mycena crocata]|nr:hypothetical protein C8R43DRAFT_955555 [Mycena crocata]
MAPRTWHGAEHQPFLIEWMPMFFVRKSQQKLYKFWGPMFEAWFEEFPEELRLGLPLSQAGGNAPQLSSEELVSLRAAVSRRKQVIASERTIGRVADTFSDVTKLFSQHRRTLESTLDGGMAEIVENGAAAG